MPAQGGHDGAGGYGKAGRYGKSLWERSWRAGRSW